MQIRPHTNKKFVAFFRMAIVFHSFKLDPFCHTKFYTKSSKRIH